MATSYVEQSHGAVVVLSATALAFSAAELWQAFRLRRSAAEADAPLCGMIGRARM
jgi:hypothetical protein